MKLNFSAAVLDTKGKPLVDPEGEITYARVAGMALLADRQDDRAETKLSRFKLALKLAAADDVEITAQEAAMLLDRVTQVCPTVIVGRFDEFINGK